jgi:hypothetical protein
VEPAAFAVEAAAAVAVVSAPPSSSAQTSVLLIWSTVSAVGRAAGHRGVTGDQMASVAGMPDDQDKWVTELQEPITPDDPGQLR